MFFQPSAHRALDNNGNPMDSATWTFYLTGTTTLTTIYSSDDLATPLANPLTSDSAGMFVPVYLDPDVTYRAVLQSAGGISTVRDIDPANDAVSSVDEIEFITPELYGAVGDGSTDDYAAFAAMIDAMPHTGGIVYLGLKAYYLSSTVHLYKPIIFQGQGIGQNPGSVDGTTYSGVDIYHGSRFVIPQGNKGFHFHTHTSEDDVATVNADLTGHLTEFSAVGSAMRDLGILGAGVIPGAVPPVYVADAEAVRTNVAIELSNIWIVNPSGDGVVVSASSSSVGYPSDYGNAAQTELRRVRILKPGRHGVRFEGADANICTTYNLDVSFAGGAGIWDTSFLGTTHYSPHLQKNNQNTLATWGGLTLAVDEGSIVVEEDSAITTIYSPYIENPTDGEVMKLKLGCTVYPGIGTAERYIDADTTSTVHNGGGIIGGYYGAWNRLDAVQTRFFYGPGPNATALVAFGFGNTEEGAAAADWKMLYNKTSNFWGLEFANAGSTGQPFQFPNAATTVRAGLTGIPLVMPNGHVFGDQGLGPLHKTGTAAPVAGTWNQGDLVWNTAPVAGGTPGWVCTTAGTPGTWKAMANLAV